MRRGALLSAGVAALVLGVAGYAAREVALDRFGAAGWWRGAWTLLSWGLVIGGSWLAALSTRNRR